MTLGPRLDLRQSQTLALTPQLQQAIRLLALSNLEILSEIAAEIEANPLLRDGNADVEGQGDGPVSEAASHSEIDAATPDSAAPEIETDAFVAREAVGDTGHLDTPIEDDDDAHAHNPDGASAPDHGLSGDAGVGDFASGEGYDLDRVAGDGLSLGAHLQAQAGERLSGIDHAVAMALIDDIDEAGYFTGNCTAIAGRLGLAAGQVEAVLAIVQRFDPAGVGARSLAECLALQAIDADRYDPCMKALIDHLDWLAIGKIDRLQKLCGLDDEDMADMIGELRGYDPKPGLRFAHDDAAPIVPDLIVAASHGAWRVEVNPASLPRLLIDRRYHLEVGAHADPRTRAWLDGCLASANALIRMLDQRQRTILKVASALVEHHRGFFDHGVAHLKPLTHRAIAERVELHESTISRVAANKYLACPRGVFPLRYFFSSAVGGISATPEGNDGGEQASAHAVKQAIGTLIAAERADAILSDDTLVTALAAQGFTVARRTVAKYREAMGLGSSVERRRAKAVAARLNQTRPSR